MFQSFGRVAFIALTEILISLVKVLIDEYPSYDKNDDHNTGDNYDELPCVMMSLL